MTSCSARPTEMLHLQAAMTSPLHDAPPNLRNQPLLHPLQQNYDAPKASKPKPPGPAPFPVCPQQCWGRCRLGTWRLSITHALSALEGSKAGAQKKTLSPQPLMRWPQQCLCQLSCGSWRRTRRGLMQAKKGALGPLDSTLLPGRRALASYQMETLGPWLDQRKHSLSKFVWRGHVLLDHWTTGPLKLWTSASLHLWKNNNVSFNCAAARSPQQARKH